VIHLFVTSRVDHCNSVLASAPKKSQTSCNGFRTLQRVWSQEPRNTSVVFRGCCVMICTGWRFHSGCSTSLPWLFIGVFDTELQGTSPTAVCQFPKFPAAKISAWPAVANCYIPRFRSIRCVIRPSSLNALGGTWIHISLLDIRDMSALIVSTFLPDQVSSLQSKATKRSQFSRHHSLGCLQNDTKLRHHFPLINTFKILNFLSLRTICRGVSGRFADKLTRGQSTRGLVNSLKRLIQISST